MRPIIKQFIRAASILGLITAPPQAFSAVPVHSPGICDIRDFGAKGDGKSLSTGAINAAISECAQQGGGVVEMPSGTWLTGTVFLKSRITLHLAAGATLLGSSDLRDYPLLPRASEGRNTTLIDAEDVQDIAIVGEGTIDGNAPNFEAPAEHSTGTFPGIEKTRNPAGIESLLNVDAEGSLPMKPRPRVMLLALHADGITLRGFRARNAPNWGIKLMCSDNIRISDLDVRNAMNIANTDALDVSNSRNAVISNSYLEAADDALVVGGPCADGWCPDQSTQRVAVNNVILHSRSAALRIGPNKSGAAHLTFSNLIIYDSNRGIMLQARDAETIEDIVFDNVSIQTRSVASPGWWGKGEPVSITVAKWAYASWNLPAPDVPTEGIGLIRNVQFNNVIARGAAPFVMYSTQPGRIQDISVRGLSMTLESGALTSSLGGNVDLTPTTPYSAGFFSHDLSAILLHNVERVSLDGTDVQWRGTFPSYYCSAIEVDGYKSLHIRDFVGLSNAVGSPAISLRHGSGTVLSDVPPTAEPRRSCRR